MDTLHVLFNMLSKEVSLLFLAKAFLCRVDDFREHVDSI